LLSITVNQANSTVTFKLTLGGKIMHYIALKYVLVRNILRFLIRFCSFLKLFNSFRCAAVMSQFARIAAKHKPTAIKTTHLAVCR
jgi:hypothetical protein